MDRLGPEGGQGRDEPGHCCSASAAATTAGSCHLLGDGLVSGLILSTYHLT